MANFISAKTPARNDAKCDQYCVCYYASTRNKPLRSFQRDNLGKDYFFYHLSQELPLIARNLKWFRKTRLKRLNAVIYTNGDTRFKVKLMPVIEDEINSTIQNYLRQDTSRDDSTARRVAQ